MSVNLIANEALSLDPLQITILALSAESLGFFAGFSWPGLENNVLSFTQQYLKRHPVQMVLWRCEWKWVEDVSKQL